MSQLILNRRARRARDKAADCLARATKVPAGVRAKLDPELLRHMAAKAGRVVDSAGVVTRI